MRKMASVQKVSAIHKIEGADKIVAYQINNWMVVDTVDKYQIDDLVIYCETDSWIPSEIAPFLSKGREPREFNGVKGERLRTVKLRGQISQGLLLSLDTLSVEYNGNIGIGDWKEGDDVSQVLNIQKWEPAIPAQLRGQIKGNFPSCVPKTEAERIQNIKTSEWQSLVSNHTFEVTEKLHGSSCTMILDLNGEFHVCSRNLDLKYDENNAYWKVAIKNQTDQMMRDLGMVGIAIQGEIVGTGLNGNQYKIDGIEFFVFNVYDISNRKYLTSEERFKIVKDLNLKHAPIIDNLNIETDVQSMLKQAEGKSMINGSEREGVVLKSQQNTDLIIKVISNKWLLKGGDND